MSEWRPIETAPKDGLLVLLSTHGGIVFIGKFRKHLGIWVDDEGRERFRTVTHWMPLPLPPSLTQEPRQQPASFAAEKAGKT